MRQYVIKGLYRTNFTPLRNIAQHGVLVNIATNGVTMNHMTFVCYEYNLLEREYLVIAKNPKDAILSLFNRVFYLRMPERSRLTCKPDTVKPMTMIPLMTSTLYLALVKNSRGKVSLVRLWIPPSDALVDMGTGVVTENDNLTPSLQYVVNRALAEDSTLDKQIRGGNAQTTTLGEQTEHMNVDKAGLLVHNDRVCEAQQREFSRQQREFYAELASARKEVQNEISIKEQLAALSSVARRITSIEE